MLLAPAAIALFAIDTAVPASVCAQGGPPPVPAANEHGMAPSDSFNAVTPSAKSR